MALEFLIRGRPFPADGGSLTIERRLNGCPTATFRARFDAPRLLTGAHLAPALSPFAGEVGRSDDLEGGAIQTRDLTAEGYKGAVGLSAADGLENGVQVERLECRLVDGHGLPLADTEHGVKVGDLLLFFRADGSALLNQALPVVYVLAGRGPRTGAIRVARAEGVASPESFPDIVRWRHATGNDIVSIERLATPVRLTSLTAAAGDGQANVAWDELTGMSGYEYRYRRGAAPWGDVAAFPAGTRTGATVTGLDNGVLYTLQVRGFISAADDNKLVGAWASVGVIPSAAPTFNGDQHDVQFFIGQAKTVTLPRLLGGELPYAYSIRPALPAGLTFRAPTTPDGSPSIGGTPAGNPLSGAFTLDGSDGTGDVMLDTFQIHVAAANANVQPYFVDQHGPDIRLIQGTAVGGSGVLPSAVSGNAPVTHSIVETLPNGVGFDAGRVRLTGTPSGAVPTGTYTLRATDADGEHTDLSFQITVVASSTGPDRPVWGAIPDIILVAGRSVHHVLPAPAGGAPPIGYALRGTALPAGLALNGLTITGVPRAAAARTQYTIVATDSGAGSGVAQTFHLPSSRPPRSPARRRASRQPAVRIDKSPSSGRIPARRCRPTSSISFRSVARGLWATAPASPIPRTTRWSLPGLTSVWRTWRASCSSTRRERVFPPTLPAPPLSADRRRSRTSARLPPADGRSGPPSVSVGRMTARDRSRAFSTVTAGPAPRPMEPGTMSPGAPRRDPSRSTICRSGSPATCNCRPSTLPERIRPGEFRRTRLRPQPGT